MNDKIDNKILEYAFALMCKARAMSEIYEENSEVTSKYVHATSKGHEAIQIALGIQLTEHDWVAPYYRDDSILLAIGLSPYELMLQLLCKKDDPFSAGRTYYSHPSLNRKGFPKIPHQSSATGMQAIPTTGAAMGIQYKEKEGISKPKKGEEPVVVCSFGDASITEGEVAEAFQMASLKKLPILYLVQDNEWDISAHASETRATDATQYAKGFGLKTYTIDGTNFVESYQTITKALNEIKNKRSPILIHAKVPLLNHHTSGVRMEWYRDDLEEAKKRDPFPKLRTLLLKNGIGERIDVQPFSGLLTDFARDVNATVIVRGLRAVSDFDYEFQMASMNAKMAPAVETVCLMASDKYHFIASSLVKEIAKLGGDVTQFVSPRVSTRLNERLNDLKTP